jgi:hypothetical protein
MEKSEEFIINRIKWKASQYDFPTKHSFYFNDLDPIEKENILKFVNISKTGYPLLLFRKTDSVWSLVCSNQLVGKNENAISSIDLNNIKTIFPKEYFQKDLTKKELPEFSKQEINELTIIDKQNSSHKFYSYNGPDLFAFWNILLMIRNIFS